jgi:ribonuclease Y
MRTLEEIASSHAGVDKVFAMQSGHDVRVMVLPEEVDEIAAQVLAREIAKQIEHDLTYPGQVKVTVCRETRTTEIAR